MNYPITKVENADHYKSLRKELKTGSLFFTKKKGIHNHLYAAHSKVAHVGMILQYEDRLFGFDSTLSGDRSGVNIFNLSNLVNPINGDLYVLPLRFSHAHMDRLKDLSKIYCHIPYERNLIRLALFYFGGHPPNDGNSLFCSELIARMFYSIAPLDKRGWPPNRYHPKDFLPESKSPIAQWLYDPANLNL